MVQVVFLSNLRYDVQAQYTKYTLSCKSGYPDSFIYYRSLLKLPWKDKIGHGADQSVLFSRFEKEGCLRILIGGWANVYKLTFEKSYLNVGRKVVINCNLKLFSATFHSDY